MRPPQGHGTLSRGLLQCLPRGRDHWPLKVLNGGATGPLGFPSEMQMDQGKAYRKYQLTAQLSLSTEQGLSEMGLDGDSRGRREREA